MNSTFSWWSSDVATPLRLNLIVFILLLPCLVQSFLSSCPADKHKFVPRAASLEDEYDDSKIGYRLVIFGLGNIGSLVATTASFQKDRSVGQSAPFFEHICGTTRSSSKNLHGVQSIPFDDYQTLAENLRRCTHILVTIPPVKPPTDLDPNVDDTIIGGRPRRWKYFCDPVLNHPKFSLNELVPANTWIGYISSTSVYGNHDGAWVTEESKVNSLCGTKGELYFRAENEWRGAAREFGWRLHVFRASGLYGNTRSALHTVRNGKFDESEHKSESNEASFTSRIHEEDVTRAVISAMQYNEPLAGNSCIWNLADDYPASRAEVMLFGKALLKEANLLPQKSSVFNSMLTKSQSNQTERVRRRSTDKKRVQNQRMKSLLLSDGQLIYPTYREGLNSILGFNRKEWTSK